MKRNRLYLSVCALLILIVPVSLDISAASADLDAHTIAEYYEQRHECQYSQRVLNNRPPAGRYYCQGKNLSWRTDHTHEWSDYQRQANQLAAYLIAVSVVQQRQNLVDRWSGVAQCESGGNWAINTGNGYFGGLQFNLGTWQAYGGSGRPDQQPAWYQATIAERVRTQGQGLGAWPVCGRNYG